MVNKTVKSIFTSPSSLPPRHQAIARSEDLAQRKYLRWDSLAGTVLAPDNAEKGGLHSPFTTSDICSLLEGTLTIHPTLPTHLRQGPIFSKQATYPATIHTNPSLSTITITITDIPSPYEQEAAQCQTLTFVRHPSHQHRYISHSTHRFGDYICKFSLATKSFTPRAVSSPSTSIFSSGNPTPTSIFSPSPQFPTSARGSTPHPPISNGQLTEYTLQVQLLEPLSEQPLSTNRTTEATTRDQRTTAGWDGAQFPWQDLGTLRFLAGGGADRQDSAMAEDGVSALDLEGGDSRESMEGGGFEAYRVVVTR